VPPSRSAASWFCHGPPGFNLEFSTVDRPPPAAGGHCDDRAPAGPTECRGITDSTGTGTPRRSPESRAVLREQLVCIGGIGGPLLPMEPPCLPALQRIRC
jgi:hypothetical protein